MTTEMFMLATLDGLTAAALLFMVALGLTLIFGVMGILNVAHGSLYAIGGYVAATLGIGIDKFGLSPALYLPALFLAAILVGPLLGIILELGLLRRILGKDHVLQLLVTFAAFMILEDVQRLVWGTQPYFVSHVMNQFGNTEVLGIMYTNYQMIVLPVVAAVAYYGLRIDMTGLAAPPPRREVLRVEFQFRCDSILHPRGCVAPSALLRHHPNVMMTKAKISGNYANSFLAKTESVRLGFDEAIMLDPQGYVAECTGENIFTVRNGMIYTPPTSAILAFNSSRCLRTRSTRSVELGIAPSKVTVQIGDTRFPAEPAPPPLSSLRGCPGNACLGSGGPRAPHGVLSGCAAEDACSRTRTVAMP